MNGAQVGFAPRGKATSFLVYFFTRFAPDHDPAQVLLLLEGVALEEEEMAALQTGLYSYSKFS